MVNKTIYFSFLIIFTLSSCSNDENRNKSEEKINTTQQDSVKVDSVETKVPIVKEKSDTLFVLTRGNNNLYGYQDTLGNWLIQPQYKLAGNFAEKLAPVLWNGTWHLINKKGVSIRKMTKLKPIVLYHELSGEESILDLTERTLPIEFPDGKKGFLDLNSGKVSQKFDDVRNYSENFAPVLVKDKWGIINRKGEWLVKPIYDNVYGFCNGRARVIHEKKYGYLNKKGILVIPLKYKSGHQFSDGIAFVSMEDNYMNLFMIDTLGNKISDKIFEEVYNFGFIKGEAEVFYNGKCIIIDKKGNKIRENKKGCQEGC